MHNDNRTNRGGFYIYSNGYVTFSLHYNLVMTYDFHAQRAETVILTKHLPKAVQTNVKPINLICMVSILERKMAYYECDGSADVM